MNITKYAIDFAVTFAVVLVVSVTVTFLYSLIVHGSGVIDWETSFRLAIILGIALPWIHQREKKQSQK
jgi:hypothetical protein